MRKLFIEVLILILSLSVQAQTVSNIRAEQRGQDIVVFYSLETSSPCEVSLLLSQDNGATWSNTLKNVSGDIGKNIAAGEKQINWKVLEEREQLVGDKMKFKVIANVKNSFEPEMVFVKGGTFQMGSNFGDTEEGPVHNVTLKSYYIGKYEISQGQWRTIMGNNPSCFGGCDNCPVDSVSWNEVQDFIKKLNNQTGENYRLPSEAEWEYAARGGKKSMSYVYSGSNDVNAVAWFEDNSGNKTHEVGLKQPNTIGIHDMSGNLWEWCFDWFENYKDFNESNPTGPSTGQYRVFRGGGFDDSKFGCRTTPRIGGLPDRRQKYIGFRLALSSNE